MPVPPPGSVTIRWATPDPSAIDERLTLAPDGSATLDVLRPRLGGDRVGRFAGVLVDGEFEQLATAGPEVELGLRVDDPAAAAVGALADTLARRLATEPLAVAAFSCRPYRTPSGTTSFALGVLGSGSEPAIFEVEAEHCAVHFLAGDTEITRVSFPPLAVGFVTPLGEDLGGVRRLASIAPGVVGGIALELDAPAGASRVRARLAGRWRLPGAVLADDFAVWTAPADL